jgi:hypothetical protein
MRTVSRPIPSTALLVAALALSACAGTQTTPLTPTSQSPAAQGQVETRRTQNQNTEVDLHVKYMAPPQAVADNATVYVVWAKPLAEDAPAHNLGAMVVGKDRKGSLKTLTPYEKFDLIVTPEPAGNVSEPTHEPVLKAKIGR